MKLGLALAGVAMALAMGGAAQAHPDAKEEANKAAVLAFYDAALNKKDAEAAAKYLGPKYIQHNPVAADGVEGFKGFIAFLQKSAPNNRSEVKRSFVDGDYVILHVHQMREPNTLGRAVIDIFRLEDGKIVEHWDTMQDVPEKAANTNGMF